MVPPVSIGDCASFANRAFSSKLKPNAAPMAIGVDVITDFAKNFRRFNFSDIIQLFSLTEQTHLKTPMYIGDNYTNFNAQ